MADELAVTGEAVALAPRAAVIAKDDKLSEAIARANDLIAKIAGDTVLTSDQKQKLIASIQSVISTGNPDAILIATTTVSADKIAEDTEVNQQTMMKLMLDAEAIKQASALQAHQFGTYFTNAMSDLFKGLTPEALAEEQRAAQNDPEFMKTMSIPGSAPASMQTTMEIEKAEVKALLEKRANEATTPEEKELWHKLANHPMLGGRKTLESLKNITTVEEAKKLEKELHDGMVDRAEKMFKEHPPTEAQKKVMQEKGYLNSDGSINYDKLVHDYEDPKIQEKINDAKIAAARKKNDPSAPELTPEQREYVALGEMESGLFRKVVSEGSALGILRQMHHRDSHSVEEVLNAQNHTERVNRLMAAMRDQGFSGTDTELKNAAEAGAHMLETDKGAANYVLDVKGSNAYAKVILNQEQAWNNLANSGATQEEIDTLFAKARDNTLVALHYAQIDPSDKPSRDAMKASLTTMIANADNKDYAKALKIVSASYIVDSAAGQELVANVLNNKITPEAALAQAQTLKDKAINNMQEVNWAASAFISTGGADSKGEVAAYNSILIKLGMADTQTIDGKPVVGKLNVVALMDLSQQYSDEVAARKMSDADYQKWVATPLEQLSPHDQEIRAVVRSAAYLKAGELVRQFGEDLHAKVAELNGAKPSAELQKEIDLYNTMVDPSNKDQSSAIGEFLDRQKYYRNTPAVKEELTSYIKDVSLEYGGTLPSQMNKLSEATDKIIAQNQGTLSSVFTKGMATFATGETAVTSDKLVAEILKATKTSDAAAAFAAADADHDGKLTLDEVAKALQKAGMSGINLAGVTGGTNVANNGPATTPVAAVAPKGAALNA